MFKKNRYLSYSIIGIIVAALGIGIYLWQTSTNEAPVATTSEVETAPAPAVSQPPAAPEEAYKGELTTVSDTFSIKVPNAWKASVSNSQNFLAIMFARPNELDSLVYTADGAPIVDQNGIPSWNGLTEHFFVISPTAARQFDPSDHLEVASEPFTFDDGHVGTLFYVVKHADEAKKYGGLQKDSEWQGRTYIYEKDGVRIEAHLALYPSTGIDVEFYESVIRSIQITPRT